VRRTVSPSEHHRRRHARVKEILFEASRLARGARSDFLSRACEGDEELRREVESLLEYADGWLEEGGDGGTAAGSAGGTTETGPGLQH
jgi:hypothetical protein